MMRWPDFIGSVRAKLVLIALLPPLVMVPVLAALLFYWGDAAYDRLLVSRVSAELITANQYLERVLDANRRALAGFADSAQLARAISPPVRPSSDRLRETRDGMRGETAMVSGLADLLQQTADREGFDFMRLLDTEGRIVAGSGEAPLGRKADWPVVRDALNGRKGAEIGIFDAQRLAEISPELARRARIELVASADALPDARPAETRGMMIHAAAPVWNAQGHLTGVVVAGVLLNNNLDFVDTINKIVYPEGSLPLGSQGTATLFLGDVRIATNARLFGGGQAQPAQRAIGTRVSRAVHEAVLGQGKTWLGSAQVVNDAYMSGYEALTDGSGERVGMLYVGYREAPFMRVKYMLFASLIGLFTLVMVASSALLLWRMRVLFRPLENMDAAMAAVESGDAAARVGRVGGHDEIARLAEHFDGLLDTLQQRNAQLSRLNAELDSKVIERTQELAQALDDLRAAQQQLIRSEKLAAIGQLTAGVAHEINNPIAVMQGNLDLLRDELGDEAGPLHTELGLIDVQIHRIRVIVTKLLLFARPDEFAGYIDSVDVNATVIDCLLLVRHELKKNHIEVTQSLQATIKVRINANELQQVLINLAVNAAHAMPRGGLLSFATQDWDGKGVRIEVRDTGSGIAPAHLARIFDPFFTTKKTQGTGLGLSISLSLIERYGGTIAVDSPAGEGAAFNIYLLAEPDFRQQEDFDSMSA